MPDAADTAGWEKTARVRLLVDAADAGRPIITVVEQWYVAGPGEEPEGPFTTEDLIQQIRRGGIDGEIKVCPATGSVWVSLGDVPEFARALRRAPTMLKMAAPPGLGQPPIAARRASQRPAPARDAAPAKATRAAASDPAVPPLSVPNRSRAEDTIRPAAVRSAPAAALPPQPVEPFVPEVDIELVPLGKESPEASAPVPSSTRGRMPTGPGSTRDRTPTSPGSTRDRTPTSPGSTRDRTPTAPEQVSGSALPAVLSGIGLMVVALGALYTYAGGEHRGLAVMLLGIAALSVAGQLR